MLALFLLVGGNVLADNSKKIQPIETENVANSSYSLNLNTLGGNAGGEDELDLEGPFYILSCYQSSPANMMPPRIMDELELDYDFYYSNTMYPERLPLSDYNTVILIMRYGYIYTDGWNALNDYVSEGGNLILMGGSPYANTPQGILNFMNCTTIYMTSPREDPNFNLVDPEHELAEGLETSNMYYGNCDYFFQVDDEEVEVIAENSDGWATFLHKFHGEGEFFYVGYDPWYSDWNNYPSDKDILEGMWGNIIDYVRGSKMSGTVTSSQTQLPLEGVTITLYNTEDDSVIDSAITDGEGNYIFNKKMISPNSYYALQHWICMWMQ